VSATDIFLSYARQDRPIAHIIADALAGEGFSVWWDAALHSGETFDEVIEQRLRAASAVVVLWSTRSVASRWVRAEATLADRRNKLAPAIIEACDRPIIFELTHAADLCGWAGDTSDVRWRTFVNDLRRLVDARRDQDAKSTVDAVPSRSEPASRKPLRPGSDDIIVAEGARSAATASQNNETDGHGEVHCLEIEDGEVAEETVVIGSAGVRIGRTAPADLVIAHKSVSREHCIVGLANDELVVTDLNSTNGTYIDDKRISRATILPVGSVLRIGRISARHEIRTRGEAERQGSRSDERAATPLPEGRFAATS
jgi:hypothetical protein